MNIERLGLEEFEALGGRWNALAVGAPGPFTTVAWLAAWWRAFAGERGVALVMRDGEDLVAGGCFVDGPGGELASATNAHSGDWDLVAVDDRARDRFWAELARARHGRLRLEAVPGGGEPPVSALRTAGHHVTTAALPASPWMELPGSFDELLASRSRNMRSQIGRRTRALERTGNVVFRTTTGGPELERDLAKVLEVEASGWKGESGTAIAASPATKALYREFAERASRAGWLRLYLLELDGEPIAADYGCVYGGCGYLIKTGFREDFGHLAPGLVLRAHVLRASVDERLGRYDFLGGPDPYKVRWADRLRTRSTVRAFRGVRTLPAYAWWSTVRPGLKLARDRARDLVERERS